MHLNLKPEILEDNIVKLIPLEENHFDALYKVASDPLIWELHPIKDRYKKEVFATFFEGAITSKSAFLILHKEKNEIIGTTRLYDYSPEKSSIAIGFTFIGREFWGGHYNKAIKKLLIDYAFQYVNSILFHVGSENIRSQKAVLKLGANKINEIMFPHNDVGILHFEYELKKTILMKRITVFCGSSFGNDKIFSEQATLLGETLAQKNIELVYGGANVGLMGALADGVLSKGGKVIGVLPDFLRSKEIAHTGLSELMLVESMHERKTKMNDLCDGVIALPGGFGTLEELFEMITWAQLGLHKKPIAILNINGFYDSLIEMIQTMVDKGLLKEVNQQMLLVDNNIENLLNKMQNYEAPTVGKWIEKKEI